MHILTTLDGDDDAGHADSQEEGDVSADPLNNTYSVYSEEGNEEEDDEDDDDDDDDDQDDVSSCLFAYL